MGVADYGKDSSGTYAYTTTEFVSWANFTSLTIGSASNGYNHQMTVQQNLVDYVKTASPSKVYWTQDVPYVSQSRTEYTVTLLDNIWNFSAYPASMTANAITGNLLGNCSGGVSKSGSTGFYYCEGTIQFQTTLPFELKMTTVTGTLAGGTYSGDSYVEFLVSVLHGATLVGSQAFDKVAFHSTSGDTPAFKVGGNNPWGTKNDAETVLCGPGGGSTVTISAINAQISESYLNGTLQPVPHAYANGFDTAETVKKVHMSILTTGIARALTGTDNTNELW